MTILTYGQIKQYATNAGFTGASADTITAIALAESGGDPRAIGDRAIGGSYGLTQINLRAHGESALAAYGDPQEALNQAYTVSGQGTNFAPWTTYKTGAYQQFLSGSTSGAGSSLTVDPATPFVGPGDGAVGGDFGGGGDGGGGSNMTPYTPGAGPGYAYPGLGSPAPSIGSPASGLPGTAAAGTSFYNYVATLLSDSLVRLGVIVLGLILLSAAVYQFAKEGEGGVVQELLSKKS